MPAPAIEALGSFYLGREIEDGKPGPQPLLYDSKDLVTHGVVLGMTGSGKTGLCVAMLEEAILDHVPAIVIDPKGDIANLMLQFPELRPGDFRPWINEDEAARKQLDPDAFAARTADGWRQGLADWDQGPERLAKLAGAAEINVFTPGSRAGIPVSILSSLAAPPREVVDDGELLGERVESTVASLLSLVGVDADPIQSPEAILLANVFAHEWREGRALSLASLIRHLQQPPFDKVGVIDLDSFLPPKGRQALALKFNNLLASPGFATWLEGPPLDVDAMLHRHDGTPRVSIFSIAHLSDSERMFFVSLLLNQMLGWMRAQGGTTSLRALLYMDEIYGYLPPTANPPSKKPMMTLLKQARAFGLGCLVATQNPVDLDYKALSNIGSWFLGRLQTERDKLRVIDGLEGAAAAQDARFDRQAMETLLSGLGARVFLLNNVHDDGPVLFHVRWVMSYLAGPLTRDAIRKLMDPHRDRFEEGRTSAAAPAANPMAQARPEEAPAPRPVVDPAVPERFAALAGAADGVRYRPHLLRRGRVRFALKKAGIEGEREVVSAHPILADGIDWQAPVELGRPTLGEQPQDGPGFAPLAGFAMNADNYKQVEKDFADQLYHEQRAEVFECPALDAFAELGESEAAFRARLAQRAREARDAAVEKLRDQVESKLRTLEKQRLTAEERVAREKAQADAAKVDAGVSILGSVLGSLLGGRRRSASTAVRRSSRAFQQHRDIAAAEAKLDLVEEEIVELEKDLERQLADLEASYDPAALELETETLKPTRANVEVEQVGLLWLPATADGAPAWAGTPSRPSHSPPPLPTRPD